MLWFNGTSRRGGSGSQMELEPPEACFESLEPRLALHQGPMITGLPPVASLESVTDSVVRILTNVGTIDVELFDSLAPQAVANFKNYIFNGKFDESFFHALTAGVLYGGRGKFFDGAGLSPILPSGSAPIGFTRSNLAGTLALVPNTGTTAANNFIINLIDNPFLNTASGGYPVFGKVVQGWNIVQTIAGFSKQNLNNALGTPNGAYFSVPVTNAYNPNVGPTEATLVRIIDIEVVKAPNHGRYYFEQYVLPDGLRTSTSIERIDLVNLETTLVNLFQVIVRYENGDRDAVIFSGTLQPGQRGSFKVSDPNIPTLNKVRPNTGYAYEVRSTRALSASLNRRDQGATVAESFQVLARVPTTQLQAWNLPGGDLGPNRTSYIQLENLSHETVNVNILIFPTGAAQTYRALQLKPFHRGGLAVHPIPGLPAGPYSVQITSNGPIVAAMSNYLLSGSNLVQGNLSLGVIGAGRAEGYLAGAYIPTTGSAHLDIEFTVGSPGAMTVNFEFTLSNGTVLAGTPVVMTTATRRVRYDLATANGSLPKDTFFSIRYFTGNMVTPVSVNYRTEVNGDVMSTPFQTATSRTVVFADGYTDPTQIGSNAMREVVSVMNPYADPSVTFVYQLLYHFGDGTTIFAPGTPAGLGARKRADHSPQDFAPVLTKINSNPQFRFYSVEVISAQLSIPAVQGGVVAQLTRFHNAWQQNMTTLPSLHTGLAGSTMSYLYLNAPEFQP